MIKRMKLSAIVAEEIKQYIKKNRLSEGDRLPSIETMMKNFGTGRSTLRESLQILETSGIVQVVNGKGTFVKNVQSYRVQTSFEAENKKKFLLELLDVRMALEGKAVDLVVQHAAQDEIETMEAYMRQYKIHLEAGDRKAANECDFRFHQVIYESCNNELLNGMIRSLQEQFMAFWEAPFGIENIFDHTFEFHLELLDGLKRKDPAAARTAFEKIIEADKRAILAVELRDES
ncbi:MAG TPA: FadR/GntR family transcriptional regulator [Bacillales bacterium]|nr:FadR/GntR family transcriptional regulator [Bacillales bacterium]